MKATNLKIVGVVFLLPFLSWSQIVNEGALQIKASTTVSFVGAYTNESTGAHNNDGELYINHSFTNDGTTASNSGTTFFKSVDNDRINISGSSSQINFYNIDVNVSTSSTEGVSVNNNIGLFVSNKVNLESGDLRLNGESQLIQTHLGNNPNTATSGSLLRDQQGITSVYAYNYWSSPVRNAGSFTLNGGLFDGTDANINPFAPQQVGFNTGDPYNGVPAALDGSGNVTVPLQISDRWLYTYSPNTTGYYGWDKIDKNTPIAPGIGFSMKGTGLASQNYVFKGVPNSGDYSFPISTGEIALVGNPYPSSIDSHELIDQNAPLFESVQIWVDGGSSSHYLASYLGGYAILNKVGSTSPVLPSGIAGLGTASGLNPERYLAVGQGFFIEALSDGIISFNNSQRVFQVEDGSNSIFYKGTNDKTSGTADIEEPERRIWFGYDDPHQTHRQLLLGFLPNCDADLNYNFGYDALMNNARDNETYFLIENDLTKKYLIQGVGVFDNTYEFPIGITITDTGNHTIMIDKVENFDEPVFIKDAELNTYYNLSEADFTPNLPAGEYLDRFSIVFQSQTLNTDTIDVFNDSNVFAYFKDDKININNNNQIEISTVSVCNMLGQEVARERLNNSKEKRISLPFNQQKGVYIVLLESGQSKKTFKIIN